MQRNQSAILALSITVAALFASAANSQAVLAWAGRETGPGNDFDIVTDMAVDSQGHVYTTGYSAGPNGHDMFTVKYHWNGARLWSHRYNGSANTNDYGRGIAIDSQDNIYVVGSTNEVGQGSIMRIVKYSPQGFAWWSNAYNSPDGGDAFYDVKIGPDDKPIATGTGGTGSCITIKYDQNASTEWLDGYNNTGVPSGLDIGLALTIDAAGNCYVVGSTYNGMRGDDMLFLKYNAAGTRQWVRLYNGPYGANSSINLGFFIEDSALDCAVMNVSGTNYLYVVGYATTAVANNVATVGQVILKMDAGNGSNLATVVGNPASGQFDFKRLATWSWDQRVYAAGSRGCYAFDANLNVVWFNPTASADVALDIDGEPVFLDGATSDARVTKINKFNGQIRWSAAYDGGGSESPVRVAMDSLGRVYAGTTSQGAGQDMVVAQFVQAPYAKISFSHPIHDLADVYIGLGNPDNPIFLKKVWDGENHGSGVRTVFLPLRDKHWFYQTPSETVVYFGKVTDANGDAEGALTGFSVVSGGATYASGNAPTDVPANSSAMAYIPTRQSKTALIRIDHPNRGDLRVEVGAGDPNSPSYVKLVTQYTGSGLPGMWCQVDLTAASAMLPPSYQNRWWARVFDGGLGDQGHITIFKTLTNNLTHSAKCLPAAILDNQRTIVSIPGAPGDLNCDGCVDDSDLAIVLGQFGAYGQNLNGDANGDGAVDDVDLAIVLQHFGEGC